MSYFKNVYKKRGKWWGETSKDQYLNISKKYFEDYLLHSPNAGIIIINNIETAGVILDNKDDANKISKFFLVGLETEINQGDLIEWYEDYWLVLQKEKRSFEAYNKILAIRCNYNLKWIDDFGILNETPSHVVGHMSNRIEDNFRMVSGMMVVPQANKNLQIILPFYSIKAEQRFLVNGEAWRVLERDLTSASGVLYLYLMEDLVDLVDDNIQLNISDYGKLNSGKIEIGLDSLTLGIEESFTFNPVLYKNDKPVPDSGFTLSAEGEDYYLTIDGNTVTGLLGGNTRLIVSAVDQPNLQVFCDITIASSSVGKNVLQLVGDESIRWGRTRTYTVLHNDGSTPAEIAATFTILNNENNLVSFVAQESTSCSIVANTDGKTGNIILRATTVHGNIDKAISVVSVW